MLIETKAALCPKCGSTMQDVKGGIIKCQNCGFQPGLTYRDMSRHSHCDPRLTIEIAGRKHCNGCSETW
jgi:hypothetical protein